MLVSIIIPVYNAGLYLERCLLSILNQTYENVEVILVDDCSTDNSYEIINEFKGIDNRIRIFKNDKNSLVGFTRNFGLRQAKGEYVWFVDADDWIELDACEKIVTKLKQTKKTDILLFGFERHLKNNKTRKKIPSLKINSQNAFPYYLQLRRGFCPLCPACVYSKELLLQNNVFFREYVFYEDVDFCAKAVFFSKNISVLPIALYNYNRENPISITSTHSKKKIKDLILAHDDLKDFMIDQDILMKYQDLLLARFLVFGLPPCIHMYLRLPKSKQKDGYFERELLSYRKSEILSKNTLFGVLTMSKTFSDEEKPLKRIYDQNIWFLWWFQNAFQVIKMINSVSRNWYKLKISF